MLSSLQKFVKQKADGAATHEMPPVPHISLATAAGPVTNVRSSAPLNQQLAELQRRSCDVLGHHLVKHPATGSLRRLGNLLLANILRLQTLWRHGKAADKTDVSAAAEMSDLMQRSHCLLNAVVSQLALCISTARDTTVLAEWGRRLVAQETVRFHALLPLVDRICDEVRRTPALRAVTPLSGLSLTTVVESQTAGCDAPAFIEGLSTARVLAWSLGDDRRLADRLPLLVLAAMFQDVGKLSIAARRAAAPQLAEEGRWLDRQHPAIGAGLFGSVRGAPPELSVIMAQHHERLDGQGFPRSLPAVEMLPEAAILATANRFAELCLEQVDGAETAFDYAKTRAAQLLVSEAEWGRWRLDFARHIADRTAAERLDDAPFPIAADAWFTAAPKHDLEGADRHRQLHDQEPALQGTHSDPVANRRNNRRPRAIVVRKS